MEFALNLPNCNRKNKSIGDSILYQNYEFSEQMNLHCTSKSRMNCGKLIIHNCTQVLNFMTVYIYNLFDTFFRVTWENFCCSCFWNFAFCFATKHMVLHIYDDDDSDDGKKLHKSPRHPSLYAFSEIVFILL